MYIAPVEGTTKMNDVAVEEPKVQLEPEVVVDGFKYKLIDKPVLNEDDDDYWAIKVMDYIAAKKELNQPDYDLVKEYELVLQKKSNMSRVMRDLITYKFRQTYELVIE